MPTTPATIRATTQQHLDVEDIVDDIVILKDGSGCLVLQANSINFDLLSEMEQEATIYAYAAILNSFTYPIQIVIHSERKDVSDYLKLIKMYEDRQTSKILKDQIRKYRRFVEETVEQNNVLDKQFYIVIPFTNIELGAAKAFTSTFGRKKGLPFEKKYIIQEAKNHLIPKRDHLMRQFTRLGIRLRQLSSPELIELFYKIYNPDSKGQKLAPAQAYITPIVQGPANYAEQMATQVNRINAMPLPEIPTPPVPSSIPPVPVPLPPTT